MERYIDAEQVKGDIRIAMAEQLHKDPFNTLPTHLAELLCRFVDDTPTADVVPRDEVQEIFKEFDRMLERYAYEPYYTVQDMEIEVNILKEKYTKGGEGE